MFGIFQGKPSRLIGNKFIGVRLIQNVKTTNGIDNNPIPENNLSLGIELTRRGPDNSWFPRKRFQWCAYISTKKDLYDPEKFQPIGREMNAVSGVALKVPKYCTKELIINSSFLDGAIYLDKSKIKKMISRIKKDEIYYKQLLGQHPTFKPILDTWRFPDSAKSLLKNNLSGFEDLKEQLIYGDGVHSFNLKYWMGSINFKRTAMQITSLFADESIKISDYHKKKLIELLRLMARLQWDDDYVPFFDSSGINFGTANMSYQYRNNGRNFFALIFSRDPEFKARAGKVLDETRNDLLTAIAPNGITFGSPHYTQATIDPILYNMLQLKQAGLGDLFKEQKDRIYKFIDFYSSLLTPPSVRFNGFRKLINFGDGSEESAPTFALLAAGLSDIDTALSSRLYYIFENGAPRQSLFGELGLAIEIERHSGIFESGSSNYEGYLSHFRAAINTDRETAAWVLNGEVYSDHRNEDRGESVIYALGAPLSLSRNSFYSPHAPDARIRSLVIPEELFPSWNKDNQPINGEDKLGNPWSTSSVIEYSKLFNSTSSMSKIEKDETHWLRRITMVHLLPEEPIIIFYDSVNNNKPNIWSMLFMSEFVKHSENDKQVPTARLHNNKSKFELPSAMPEKALMAGWNNFHFTGQKWKKHFSGGIDWNVYAHTSSPSTFTVSQWTNTWQNTLETEEFLATNGVPYSETQQILRWRSSKPFFAVISPYIKNSKPLVQRFISPNLLELAHTERKYIITPDYIDMQDKNGRRVITFLSAKQTDVNEFKCAGGITEIEMNSKQTVIRISGKSGHRRINLPFEVSTTTINKEISIKISKGQSMLEIEYSSPGLNIGPKETGFREYRLSMK